MAITSEKNLRIQKPTLWLASVALVLAGCGGDATREDPSPEEKRAAVVEGQPPTAAALTGLWLQVEDPHSLGLLVWFNSSGLFALDARGDLPTNPAARGTFDLDEGTITFTSGGSDLCAEGNSSAWQAGLPADGVLHVVHAKGATDLCPIPLRGKGTLIRLSPSLTGVFPDSSAVGNGKGRSPSASELNGMWLVAERPGLMVWFGQDGSFAIDNGANLVPATLPDVKGTHRLGSGTITFSTGLGGACGSGIRFAWRAKLSADGLLRIVHIKEGLGNCRVPRGTEWTLVRVSPSSAASSEIMP